MKRFVPVIAAALLMGSGAYAQSINIGPAGIGLDTRTPRERAVDREMRHEREERMRQREWRRANYYRGDDCRTVTTEREIPRGVVRRTTRICD